MKTDKFGDIKGWRPHRGTLDELLELIHSRQVASRSPGNWVAVRFLPSHHQVPSGCAPKHIAAGTCHCQRSNKGVESHPEWSRCGARSLRCSRGDGYTDHLELGVDWCGAKGARCRCRVESRGESGLATGLMSGYAGFRTVSSNPSIESDYR